MLSRATRHRARPFITTRRNGRALAAKAAPMAAERALRTEVVAEDQIAPPHVGDAWEATACLCTCHYSDERCDESACRGWGERVDFEPAVSPAYPAGSLHGPTIDRHGGWTRAEMPTPMGTVADEGQVVRDRKPGQRLAGVA